MRFERIGSEEIWQGRIGGVREDRFRYEDGGEADREIMTHPGATAIVPYDGEVVWLVRQPREPVGEFELLEIPAGKLDVPGEDTLAAAKRELAEEIGKGARQWTRLTEMYNSPGILTEKTDIYLAEDLYDENIEAEEEERIDIVEVRVGDLDDVIAEAKDAKTLIGLLLLQKRLQ